MSLQELFGEDTENESDSSNAGFELVDPPAQPQPPARNAIPAARLNRCRLLGEEYKKVLDKDDEKPALVPRVQTPKNRYWVLVRGATGCLHAGIAESAFICKTHTHRQETVRGKAKQVCSPCSLGEPFASLTEAKCFWRTVFPGVEPETLDTCCGDLRIDG